MSSRRTRLCAVAMLLVGVTVASGQQRTIPEIVARGEGLSEGTVPSGPGPTVRMLLDMTDLLAVGQLGDPQGYLSDDQMEVFTDYRLIEPTILFERGASVPPTSTSARSIVLTQRGGTVNIQGKAVTAREAGLAPLKAGTHVLCLLKQAGDKYQIVDRYYGVFEIKDGMIEPLMTSRDFAPDYRGRSLQDAVQSMLAVLQRAPGK